MNFLYGFELENTNYLFLLKMVYSWFLKSLELVILNHCSVGFPGRRAKVYAELVGFNEYTRAGPPRSTGGRHSVAEVEAAGTLGVVL